MALTTGRRVAVTVASVSGRGFWLKFSRGTRLVDPRSLHSRSLEPLVSSLVSSPAQGLARVDPSRSAAPVPSQQRSLPSSRSSKANLAFGGTRLQGLSSSRLHASESVADSHLDRPAWLGVSGSQPDPSRPSCVTRSRSERTGVLSGACPSADAFGPRGRGGERDWSI